MIYEEIYPNILLLHEFYTPEDCKEELEYANKIGFLYTRIGGSESRYRAVKDDAMRASQIWNRIHFFPALDQFYKNLRPDPFFDFAKTDESSDGKELSYLSAPQRHDFTKVGNFWNAIGLNERLRYYQYELGHRFAEHFDLMFRIDDITRTFLTFIIYLNDDFEGGETRFVNLGIVKPKLGMAIIFPHEIRHEGMMVTKGIKTVLRSDIIYRLEEE